MKKLYQTLGVISLLCSLNLNATTPQDRSIANTWQSWAIYLTTIRPSAMSPSEDVAVAQLDALQNTYDQLILNQNDEDEDFPSMTTLYHNDFFHILERHGLSRDEAPGHIQSLVQVLDRALFFALQPILIIYQIRSCSSSYRKC